LSIVIREKKKRGNSPKSQNRRGPRTNKKPIVCRELEKRKRALMGKDSKATLKEEYVPWKIAKPRI